MSIESASAAAYVVAALLFILALAGLSKHESAKAGNYYGIAAWRSPWSRPWSWPSTRTSRASGSAC